MLISKNNLSLFNISNLIVQVLMVDQESYDILSTINESKVICNSKILSGTIVYGEKFVIKNSELFVEVSIDNDWGLVSAEKNVLIFQKQKGQVRLVPSEAFSNQLNKDLLINNHKHLSEQPVIAYSVDFAIYKNYVYELISLNSEIIGFAITKSIEPIIKMRKYFSIVDDTKLFSNSSLDRNSISVKSSDKEYKSELFLESNNAIRFKKNGKKMWIDSNNTNINIDIIPIRIHEPDDVLVYSLVYQLKEKLNMSNQYYHGLLMESKQE